MNKPDKILVIRNDKLGDFMLAWPSYALIKKQYPEATITALVPEYTAPMAEQCEWIDTVLIDKKTGSFFGDTSRLSKIIKRENFDVSISLFSELRTAVSLWAAGVKVRVGPATKFAQIFLNQRLRQKRSRSLKPEFQYNLDLIRFYIDLNHDVPVDDVQPPYLTFDAGEIDSLRKKMADEQHIPVDAYIILLHPGSGGSAINLTLEQYSALARHIAENSNAYFVITAGPDELATAEELSKLLQDTKHHIHLSSTGILDFCKLINICDVFISGSTGPLHIAGALNVCTVAFYPARRSATALRWQTLNSAEKRICFSPETYTGENDMEKIDVQKAADQIVDKFLH